MFMLMYIGIIAALNIAIVLKKTCLEQVNFYISLSDMPYDEKLSEKDQIVKIVKNGFGTVTQHILLGSVLVTLLYLW